MSRQARAKSSSGIYHVILRGINKQLLFECQADYDAFLNMLKSAKEKEPCNLFAYCLMPNHVHLLLQITDETPAHFLKRLAGSYALWFNNKYERTGHLFQNRYLSETVENDAYLLTVIRYIHMNPVKAGLCSSMDDYEYSSCFYYFDPDGLIDSQALGEVIDPKRLSVFQKQNTEDDCLDIDKVKIPDSEVLKTVLEISGCSNISEFQQLPKQKKKEYICCLLKKNVPRRQASRVTGMSIGIVRRL